MHICFITNEYPKPGYPHGGLGSFVKTIAEALVLKGIQVSVVGINYDQTNEYVMESGVHIHRLKKNNVKGFSWLLNAIALNQKIKFIHKNQAIDIVESPELGLAFIKKIKEIKYVIRLHGGHHFFAEAENRGIDTWKGFQEKISFKKADAFIAVSEYVKTHTNKYLSFYNKKIEIINNPISLDNFKPIPEVKTVNHSIVFVGTVCEKKGIRQLVLAMPYVLKQFPDAHLHIYGRDWFFPNKKSYMAYLQELIKNQNILNISFHGLVSQEQLPEIYQQANVCVFPSHVETQGLVAPEAMAMEKIVIFTKFGPGPETIIDHETGLLCNPLEPNDIAEKIIWTFTHKENSILIGKKAREAVLEKFNPNILIKRNIDFYVRLTI